MKYVRNRFLRRIIYFLRNLWNTIKSCYLCIRFPFLYPRNRWDGKHHTYALGNKLSNLNQHAIQSIGITGHLEKENLEFEDSATHNDITIKLDRSLRKVTVSNKIDSVVYDLKNLLWNSDTKFQILGLTVSEVYSGRCNITIHVKTADETDDTNYGFFYSDIKLVRDKKKLRQYNVLNWVDKEILDRVLFIPTYTELDAMPDGWRKAFGIEMCKDIKKSLLKAGGRKALRNYRIDQIKEKWGRARWYDHNSTDEIWKEIIPHYEELSGKICIDCGKPATCISVGWISPYCDDCKIENHNYVSITEDDAWDKALTYYWPKEK